MLKDKSLTLEFVSNILKTRGLISEDQYKDIVIKGEAQRARIFKSQEGFNLRNRSHALKEPVSTAEVIASFDLERADNSGKNITEDFVTEIIASEP